MGQKVDQVLPEYREIRLIIGDARARPVRRLSDSGKSPRDAFGDDSLCRRAGIYGEHRAGDAFGLVTEEKLDSVDHVVDVGKSAKRAASRDLFAALALEILSHVRVHEPWRDGVHVYTQPTDFARE